MNKKILAVLAGGVMLSSVGTFQSCSDYDDDIRSLQEQIDSNAESAKQMLEEKVNNLTSMIEALQAQDATLQKALEEAQKNLDKAIQEGKEYADIQAAAAQKAAIEASQKSIDAAKAALEAGLAEANKKIDANSSAIKTQGEQIAALVAADAKLEEAIATANAQIEEAKNMAAAAQAAADKNAEDIKAVVAKLDAAKKELGEQISLLDKKVTDGFAEAAKKTAEVEAKLNTVEALAKANEEAIKNLHNASLLDKIEANQKDIKALQGDLAELSKTVEANLVAAKAYTDAQVEELKNALGAQIADVKEALAQAKENLEAADAQLAEEDKALKGLIEGNTKYIAGVEADLEALHATVTTQGENIATLQSDLQKAVEKMAADKKEVLKNIADTKTELENKLVAEINAVNKTIEEKFNILSRQLKGLVFSPTAYYQGIETIDIRTYKYNEVKLFAASTDNDVNQIDSKDNTLHAFSYSVPEVVASYLLNPSNAGISLDADKYSMIVNHAQMRGNVEGKDLKVEKVTRSEKRVGEIDVRFSVAPDMVQHLGNGEEGKIDVAALRYEADTLITSDFAALTSYNVTDFVINMANKEGALNESCKTNNKHLALTPAEAKAKSNVLSLNIPYTNVEGVNLDKWFNVHYAVRGDHQTWGGQETVNEKNFSIKYELVGYIDGHNQTNESQHATVKGSQLTIHPVGAANSGNDRKIIGRTPMLRVYLADNNQGGKVAAVGYIMVKITDVPQKPVVVEDEAATIKNPYTVQCDGLALNNVAVVDWLFVEDKVLGHDMLNMSKEEFEKEYVLDCYDGNNARQFVKTGADQFETASKYFGEVRYTSNDMDNPQTNVITWTVTNQEAYYWFKGETETSKSVWVRFVKKSNPDFSPVVYVMLTWTPSAINVHASAKLNDADKKASAWRAQNSSEAGKYELQCQIGNSTTYLASAEFDVTVINDTYTKTPFVSVKEQVAKTYPALANNLSVTYQFAPANLQTQKGLQVANNGLSIKYGYVELATINPLTGAVNLKNNSTVKELLNRPDFNNKLVAAADSKSNTNGALTFTVQVVAKTCAPANNVTVENNKLDVKIVKPLFANFAKGKDMILNTQKDLVLYVKDVVTFRDFNNFTYESFSDATYGLGKNMYQYYGVTAIDCDVNAATTDYSGKWAKVDTKDFVLTTVGAQNNKISKEHEVVEGLFGSIMLEQVNQNVPTSFSVKVPCTISYNWGKLTGVIEFDVYPTL